MTSEILFWRMGVKSVVKDQLNLFSLNDQVSSESSVYLVFGHFTKMNDGNSCALYDGDSHCYCLSRSMCQTYDSYLFICLFET